MAPSPGTASLGRPAYLLLIAHCLVMFGISLVVCPPFSGHESVIPESSREMALDHDWIIPKCGGFAWLERPPLCHWINVAIAALTRHPDSTWTYRLAPVLLATLVVLLVARLAATWYGSTTGLLSGLILGSMWEFHRFAVDPEADIFLCAVVTAAISLFVHSESLAASRKGASGSLMAFFVLLGATNLVKGLLFGTLMVLVPIGAFLVWNADLRGLRRYCWLWGWLAFFVVALPWPIAAYLRQPLILEIWHDDYLGRLHGSYMREPAWYYAAALPAVILPWTGPALLALGLTAGRAFRERHSPERFLWCWAVITPAVFSIPHGKHHHYLLQCLVPWAVLAALGTVRIWESVSRWPTWLRNPLLPAAVMSLGGDLLILHFRAHLAGPRPVVVLCLVVWPLLTLGGWWAIMQRRGRIAGPVFFSVVATAMCLGFLYEARCVNRYHDDVAFLRRVPALAGTEHPLIVVADSYPLESFHLLFYADHRAALLPRIWDLPRLGLHDPVVYVIARAQDQVWLSLYGTAEPVLMSRSTRGEKWALERRTLFRCRLRPELLGQEGSPTVPLQTVDPLAMHLSLARFQARQ